MVINKIDGIVSNPSSCIHGDSEAPSQEAPVEKTIIIATRPTRDVAGTQQTKVRQINLIDEPMAAKSKDQGLPWQERYQQLREKMELASESKQARLVRKFVRSLSPTEQAQLPLEVENELLYILMRSMVHELERTEDKTTAYQLSQESIGTLYEVATTHPAFEEKNKQKALIVASQLNHDGFINQTERDWASMKFTARIEALTTITNRVARQFGLPDLELVPYEEKKKRSDVLGWFFVQGEIWLNVRGDAMDDFRTVFSTVVHEVCHAYQERLAKELISEKITSTHPDFQPAFAFWLNYQLYQSGRHANEHQRYLGQPLEIHARSTADIIVETALGASNTQP